MSAFRCVWGGGAAPASARAYCVAPAHAALPAARAGMLPPPPPIPPPFSLPHRPPQTHSTDTFCRVTGRLFTPRDLAAAELSMLCALRFSLARPTAAHAMPLCAAAAELAPQEAALATYLVVSGCERW